MIIDIKFKDSIERLNSTYIEDIVRAYPELNYMCTQVSEEGIIKKTYQTLKESFSSADFLKDMEDIAIVNITQGIISERQ